MAAEQDWVKLYRIAALETDWSQLEDRIQAAESAIKAKLQDSVDRTAPESQSRLDALDKLTILRADLATWRKSNG